jgi:para-aminobenzoate synthetase component 1
MIVDLLRNDLGRVCEYGSVAVEKLCDVEEHPTLFHLVSTIGGELRDDADFSDILRATFPCGSITGAPKIRTMQIIDEVEKNDRGLSMGAIGYFVPAGRFYSHGPALDLGVAIRTMVICGDQAVFNVGGGILIESDPEAEYEETQTKAKVFLEALNTYADTISDQPSRRPV